MGLFNVGVFALVNVLGQHGMLTAETAMRGPAHYLLEFGDHPIQNPSQALQDAADTEK